MIDKINILEIYIMDNPIDKVISRKKKVDEVNKEIRRRKNISKKTKGKTRKRKAKNKGKKRKKKKITTTQVAQPPIRLTDKEAKALLQVNITAKERRKKRKSKPKTFAEKRAEEISKTGVADPSVLKAQQKIASEILGYTTQTKDPVTLRGRKGRYNVAGGVAGFGNVSSRYDTGDDQLGIRTGLQSEAVRRKGYITIEDAEEMVANDRRDRRIPNVRRGTKGTQTRKDDDDDDDDDDPRGGGRITKRTPQPQPEPEPAPRRPRRTQETGTSPIYIPPPIPRRTPPESYFAGRISTDTPLRFRPLSQPVPPQSPEENISEEIIELTEGQPSTPITTGFQPVGTPQQPQFPDAPSEPSGIAFDDEGFATPTATGLVLPPEEPLPAPSSRLQGPSAIKPELGITRKEEPEIRVGDVGSERSAFRPPSRAGRASPVEPEPEPEVIQSVRRGRGRPKGSKNKPRTATPFVLEETGQGIDRATLKFEMVRIQNLLKQRLGSWRAKEVDEVQSLEELNEAIQSITDDAETAELIRLFWQIRLQLGQLKKL